ncbi:antA/AntB antirepressor family protein [Nitrosomonas sp. Nm166]|uniref:antA/AntB antirepressor family protein n=1 Tax=Nitrosomonas sp. Nm166 TaxID=1881054 RepID=UPI0008E2CBF9|nr:antA/AntB antirepressor family protein [Nitrosomonas sp. Nm166]SFF26461.1 anti-repressor protein [Nitrosomonas sp. Nm166]
MTNQLIPTFTGELAGETQPLVNARDLHGILESGHKFADWIKERIEKYGFIENEDYRFTNSRSGNNQGLRRFLPGGNRIDYHLSLDMAKELAMLEGNEKGRQARRYFIQMEKLARQEIPAVFRRQSEARPFQVETLQMERMKEALLKAYPSWRKIKRYFEMGLTQKEIGRLIRKSESTVRRSLDKMTACGVINRTINPLLSAYGKRGNQKRLALMGGNHVH